MIVDTRKTRRARQALVCLERNVVLGARIPILLGQSIIDNVEDPRLVPESNEKVFGLDVSMDKVARVKKPQALDCLHGNHQDVSQTERAAKRVLDRLERGTQLLKDNEWIRVVVPKVKQARDTAMARLKNLVDLGFIGEQIVLGHFDLDSCRFSSLLGYN